MPKKRFGDERELQLQELQQYS